MLRPASDILTTGWTSSAGGPLYAQIDETSANDTDYLTSPSPSSPTDLILGLDATAPAGTYTIRVRASAATGVGQIRVSLLDSSNVSQGDSAWQPLTATLTTYAVSLTSMAAATRVRLSISSLPESAFLFGGEAMYLGSDVLSI